MTVDPNSIDLAAVIAEHLESAESDLLSELLRTFVQALMSADADAACGAAYGTRSSERTNTRRARPTTWRDRPATMRRPTASLTWAPGGPRRGTPHRGRARS